MWIGKLYGTWDLRTCGVNIKNKDKQYEKQLRQLWGASSLSGMFCTTSAVRQLCVLSPRLFNVAMQWAVLGWKNATSERGLNLNDGSMYGLLKILCCLVTALAGSVHDMIILTTGAPPSNLLVIQHGAYINLEASHQWLLAITRSKFSGADTELHF